MMLHCPVKHSLENVSGEAKNLQQHKDRLKLLIWAAQERSDAFAGRSSYLIIG